jgi:hypothetical protein
MYQPATVAPPQRTKTFEHWGLVAKKTDCDGNCLMHTIATLANSTHSNMVDYSTKHDYRIKLCALISRLSKYGIDWIDHLLGFPQKGIAGLLADFKKDGWWLPANTCFFFSVLLKRHIIVVNSAGDVIAHPLQIAVNLEQEYPSFGRLLPHICDFLQSTKVQFVLYCNAADLNNEWDALNHFMPLVPISKRTSRCIAIIVTQSHS